MELSIIAAVSNNNVLGNQGRIPWHIPEDLKRFKRLTEGCPVIMGKNTFVSIVGRNHGPLPKRKNIVLSRSSLNYAGVYVAHSVREAIILCDNRDSYVIGGEQVYEEFLKLTSRIELTRVHRSVDGDVFFPEIDWTKWKETFLEGHGEYSFHTYERR